VETGLGAPAGASNSEIEAVRWYRKAAESGSAVGELNLGLAYLNGASVRQDLPEAVKWFRKAAAHGSAAACDQLGRAYEYGEGVARDESIADSWYRLAIKTGYRQAEQDLSALHKIARRPASNAPKPAGGRSPEADFTF